MQQSPSNQLPLTKTQLEALRAVAEGFSMKDIAAQTGTSIHTVHTHLRMAYKRLNAKGSNNAVAIAIREKLI